MNQMTTCILFSFAGLAILTSACGEASSADSVATESESAISTAAADTAPGEDQKDAGAAVADAAQDTAQDTAEAEGARDTSHMLILANALADREQALAMRERELLEREQLLLQLEQSALGKKEELQKLKTEIETLLAKLQERHTTVRQKNAASLVAANTGLTRDRAEQTEHLVATVKNMRPDAGAGLLSSIDERDAVAVLKKLGARQVAGLLGEMDPDKAAKLTSAMLGPRSMDENTLSSLNAPLEEPTAAEPVQP